ncbi:MAG: ACT domain-containing protein [Oscillospiraceae bacterium]|nr:ACT domain-containing protein [Oscillospiraceae bacterium]
MRAVVTVIGKDMVGILAKVTAICAAHNVNVLEVSQSIMQELFAMVMLVDISKCNVSFASLADEFDAAGEAMGLKIHTMHEDVFNAMHRI